MSLPGYVTGLPGVQAAVQAAHRIIFRDGIFTGFFSGGRIIDGTLARDPDNTGDTNVLRAGLIMGRVTASGKYANSIIGVTGAAYTSGGTSLTVTTQAAAEIVRRIGTSGTFKIVGPPSAAGTVATATVTFSAVNTGTGVVTVTNIGANYISGSLIVPTDGSETFKTVIPDGFGVNVFTSAGSAADQPFSPLPIAGTIVSANLINWPTDTSLRAYVKTQFSAVGDGKWIFDDGF